MTDIKEHRNWIAIQVSALRAKFYAPRLDPEVHKAYLVSWADTLQPYSKEEIKEAMASHVRDSPRITPNEGMIRELIIRHRPKIKPPPTQPLKEEAKISTEERQRISKEVMSTFTRIVKKHKI